VLLLLPPLKPMLPTEDPPLDSTRAVDSTGNSKVGDHSREDELQAALWPAASEEGAGQVEGATVGAQTIEEMAPEGAG
jgi:hypothetical protein